MPSDARQNLVKQFVAKNRRKPTKAGFPRSASPTPSEDDALFNPLVHGNRRLGQRNKGPVRRGR